jgi:hypothetical protein
MKQTDSQTTEDRSLLHALLGKLEAALMDTAELRDALENEQYDGRRMMSVGKQCLLMERVHHALSGAHAALRPSSPSEKPKDAGESGVEQH